MRRRICSEAEAEPTIELKLEHIEKAKKNYWLNQKEKWRKRLRNLRLTYFIYMLIKKS